MSSAEPTFGCYTRQSGWIGLGRIGLLCMLLSQPICSQQIVNGSFEINDLDCGINMPNIVFNAHVSNIVAFGGQSEIDLLSDTCNYGVALDGDYFLGLYNNNFPDAFSFELTQTLKANNLYKLRFASKLGMGIFNKNSKVVIGLTNAVDNYGEILYVTPALDSLWQYYELQFSPKQSFKFISVRITSIDPTWVFLDDFSLECPSIDLGRDTALCVVENFRLDAGNYFETYQWSDFSTESNLKVTMPGEYWVHAQNGECNVSDTIVITELPFNCNCRIYLPNIFSPNEDGINDAFFPSSPCEMLDYKLQIFDRWGQLVFVAAQPNEQWKGYFRGKALSQGVYLYMLSYRFYYQQDVQQQTGSVTLVRL